MYRSNERDIDDRSPPRRGAALVVALICVLVVTMVSAVLVRTALVQREQLERDAWLLQADWLAASAHERSLALLASQADYAGETWLPTTADGRALGRVVVEIAESGDPGRELRVTVDVPDHPVERVRVVRSWRLEPAESSSSEPGSVVDEAVMP